MRTASWRLRHPGTLFRRGRVPGIRTAKTTLAAMLSYGAASYLDTSTAPVLAPLTALLVVQLTLYETVASGFGRVASVLAGVLVAVGMAEVVGLTWWSLGLAVAGSLVIGRMLRLGANLLEVPISAMIVLAVGGSEKVALGRVYETLIGAAVGVAVNLAIAPPLYVQPAEDALGELAERMSRFLTDLADQLREQWSREAADRWLGRARALGGEVSRADETLGRAEQRPVQPPRSPRSPGAAPAARRDERPGAGVRVAAQPVPSAPGPHLLRPATAGQRRLRPRGAAGARRCSGGDRPGGGPRRRLHRSVGLRRRGRVGDRCCAGRGRPEPRPAGRSAAASDRPRGRRRVEASSTGRCWPRWTASE